MQCCAIVAMSDNRVIGKNQKLPWHLPADFARVKSITKGQAILMGRKTYESIGRPLPDRDNFVLTRDANYQAPGCIVVTSFEQAVALCKRDRLVLFGGEGVYREFLPKVEVLYLTLVHAELGGDAFFPELDSAEWEEVSKESHPADDRHDYAYTFYEYRAIAS
jgi:dihydrofolate reductase